MAEKCRERDKPAHPSSVCPCVVWALEQWSRLKAEDGNDNEDNQRSSQSERILQTYHMQPLEFLELHQECTVPSTEAQRS